MSPYIHVFVFFQWRDKGENMLKMSLYSKIIVAVLHQLLYMLIYGNVKVSI